LLHGEVKVLRDLTGVRDQEEPDVVTAAKNDGLQMPPFPGDLIPTIRHGTKNVMIQPSPRSDQLGRWRLLQSEHASSGQPELDERQVTASFQYMTAREEVTQPLGDIIPGSEVRHQRVREERFKQHGSTF